MVAFEVDPDSLVAAAEVARRQGEHVQSTAAYIGGPNSRFEAFRGVLSLFRGDYEATVEHALKGMRDSGAVAEKVRSSFADCRDGYLASDRASYETFEKVFGDQVALPAYVAPGSGQTTPGGPPQSQAGDPGQPGDESAFGLAKLPPWMKAPLDQVVTAPPGPESPPWTDPQSAARDGLADPVNDWRHRREYLALREQGYSPQEAYAEAFADVDDRASSHVYDQMEDRRAQAFDDAYHQARDEGQSTSEARDTASQAAADQHHADAVEHQQRDDVLGTAGTYLGAYDEAGDLVRNVESLADHAHQLHETNSDIEDYEDYENEPVDTSAQDWAKK